MKCQMQGCKNTAVVEVTQKNLFQTIQNAQDRNAPVAEPLLDDAIAIIQKEGRASVSMLQRRFRIGYTRAAVMMDEIERLGIVGPPDGSNCREVFTTQPPSTAKVSPVEGEPAVPEDAANNHCRDEEIRREINYVAASDLLSCPFCGERDFDKSDLKHHLEFYCDAFKAIESYED